MEKELDFSQVLNIIQEHRQKAYRKINEELVTMYYEVGQYLSTKLSTGEYGDGVISNIAAKIKEQYPTLKGFSKRGLYQMIQFYETYKDNEKVRPLAAQLSWTNNLLILRGTKSIEEKEFYIRMCIQNNYSKRELRRQIVSHYYERYMLSNGSALESLEPVVGEEDEPNTKILDQYSLELLDLPNNYKEKDLKSAIMSNLKDFILEIGKDFSFVGQEYRIQVGNRDFFIDLLFYNRAYSCLVAFELKIGEFEPEYLSKMNFYLEALDRQERKEGENPSVGIILCSSKNEVIVEYSLARSNSQTAISTYETKLIDKKLLQKKIIEYKERFKDQ
jgi:predicted nuclease of restriction endonuclease-like (RecB) superfamily